jgi:hypothetical protein
MQVRLSNASDMMRIRKHTVGRYVISDAKLEGVSAEMRLNVLAYNMKRVMQSSAPAA